jgi:hypothetical protein
LPLFGQGPRTFWQRNLFDFREAKLSLNLYQNILNRKSYSYYLRRQYSTHRDSPITSIIWELHYQDIVNPVESALHGSHLDPTITTRLLNRFDFTPQGDLQGARSGAGGTAYGLSALTRSQSVFIGFFSGR